MRKEDIRNERSRQAIKDGLLKAMEQKPFIELSVAEVARAANVSRSTFYMHYNNLEEVFEAIADDIQKETQTLRARITCDECAQRNARPFCAMVRDKGKYAPLVRDSQFMKTQFMESGTAFEGDVYGELVEAGLNPAVAMAVYKFQMSGCYAAARFVPDDADWEEVRSALDTFIAGGVAALAKKM